jgi:membrane protease YdiL (CAAX protease family)
MGPLSLPFTRRPTSPGPAPAAEVGLRVQPSGAPHSARPVAQVLGFVSLTYVGTWTFFLVADHGGAGLRLPLMLLGSFMPSLVAIALTARGDGRRGVRELLARLVQWRVGLRWYVFALTFLAVVKLAVAVVYRVTTGGWPHFGETNVATILVAIVVSGIVGGPLGEEIGWRGYALPRLTQRWGLAPASLLLGVVWACWHLPLFFLAGLTTYSDQFGQSFPTYLLQVTAFSVAIAWLMGNTRGSLLLAVLMHSAINQTKDIVPSKVAGADSMWALSSSSVAWLTVAALWLCAGYFLARMHLQGRVTRSDQPPGKTSPSS